MDIIKLLGNGVGGILKAGYTIGKSTTNSFTEGVKESFRDPADNIVGNMEEEATEVKAEPVQPVQTEFDFEHSGEQR